MRILLAEDDTSLGDTIQSWLRLDGHAVDWVRRGDSAQTALATHHYDCVLLDRGLPGLSGDTLLAALRAGGDTVPVILITAFNALADRVEGLDLGADDYLVKPFELEEMSARIRAAVPARPATCWRTPASRSTWKPARPACTASRWR